MLQAASVAAGIKDARRVSETFVRVHKHAQSVCVMNTGVCKNRSKNSAICATAWDCTVLVQICRLLCSGCNAERKSTGVITGLFLSQVAISVHDAPLKMLAMKDPTISAPSTQ